MVMELIAIVVVVQMVITKYTVRVGVPMVMASQIAKTQWQTVTD